MIHNKGLIWDFCKLLMTHGYMVSHIETCWPQNDLWPSPKPQSSYDKCFIPNGIDIHQSYTSITWDYRVNTVSLSTYHHKKNMCTHIKNDSIHAKEYICCRNACKCQILLPVPPVGRNLCSVDLSLNWVNLMAHLESHPVSMTTNCNKEETITHFTSDQQTL